MSKNIVIKYCIGLFFLGNIFGFLNPSYYTFEQNSHRYHLIEYSLIKNNLYNDVFIFNQPYKFNQINSTEYK